MPFAPPSPDAMTDTPRKLTYSDYLSLDTLLTSQHPRSPDHNEMLFIVQHQTSELWMKLMLHELRAAIGNLHDDALPAAFKMLARVTRIMEQLVSAWTVLSTLTVIWLGDYPSLKSSEPTVLNP